MRSALGSTKRLKRRSSRAADDQNHNRKGDTCPQKLGHYRSSYGGCRHLYGGTTDENGKLKDEHVEIGTDESSRLEHIAARTYIEKTVIHKVMLKSDSDKTPEDRKIISVRLPLAPVSRCMAGASVLTDIIIGKFMYHLPFYRQIQQY